jgi:chorismate synthase
MIKYITAGESHGPGLTGVIEGMPANIPIEIDKINHELYRRQQGYGRGGRMKIETDKVEILSGLRFGKTLASPISFIVRNKDWKNWLDEMNIEQGESKSPITRPRPGHADLSGALKYEFDDMRNVLERSSARETTTRVAIGSFCKQFLEQFDIKIFSHVISIGKIAINHQKIEHILLTDEINERADTSQVRILDQETEEAMIEHIREAKKNGDTLGGVIEIIIRNVPPGLGSYIHWDKKLDSLLSAALISIQAVKAVEFGSGFRAAQLAGSEFHDEIYYNNHKFQRKTNNAGGIEGGMSTGDDIVIRIMKKPIPTLMKPLHSVDFKSKEEFFAHKERSDVTAVPACSVIAEAAAAPVIANALIEKFGGDTLNDIKNAFSAYLKRIGYRAQI